MTEYSSTAAKSAMVKITVIGKGNTLTRQFETSTDLPSDAMGEFVTEVIHKVWTMGEDPTDMTVVINFS